MSKRAQQNHFAAFEATVAPAVLRGGKTVAELAEHCDVDTKRITAGKA